MEVSEGASVDTSEEYSDDTGSVGWSASAGALNDRAAVAINIANNDFFMIDSILPIMSSPKSLNFQAFSLNIYLITRAKSVEQSLYQVLNS